MGWEYNSHIVCMCIIMRWSRNLSANWVERFWTSSLLCTYNLCDYYTPIPILSPLLFTPSLYAPILNLQDFSFTCTYSAYAAPLFSVKGNRVKNAPLYLKFAPYIVPTPLSPFLIQAFLLMHAALGHKNKITAWGACLRLPLLSLFSL